MITENQRIEFEQWYLDYWRRSRTWAKDETLKSVTALRCGDGYDGGYIQGCYDGGCAAKGIEKCDY